ncbi:MAG: hemolysin secretion protein D [Methylobacterium sp.]|nr:MAG: hemolysin secretion protein D [Methylobacterium sp.]
MKPGDFAFANDLKAAVELQTPRTLVLIIRASLLFLVIALVWAYFAIVDEVTRATAKVIPSRQVQTIQSLEGGLVQEILVTEGQTVRQGDILMRIDDTVLGSQFGEARERRAALRARHARLEQEARWSGPGVLNFPEDANPAAAAAERALYEARVRKLLQDLEVLDQQAQQKSREKDEMEAQARRLASTKPLLERELTITRRLFADRVVPEIEMLRLDRQVAELNGQIDVTRASLTRAEGAIREAQARREGAILAFRASAEEDLAKTRGDLAVLDETLRAAEDRVRRTELRAPVRGIVNKINLTTIGAVVQPAATLVEIVPLDDTLLVEARVRPQDIGFIRPQQSAVVKITAYDSATFGSLSGRVERVSADTTTDPRGEAFYRIVVQTDKNHLGSQANPLPILPGMVAQVEILTGRKSILSYLLKPARLLRDEALKER